LGQLVQQDQLELKAIWEKKVLKDLLGQLDLLEKKEIKVILDC